MRLAPGSLGRCFFLYTPEALGYLLKVDLKSPAFRWNHGLTSCLTRFDIRHLFQVFWGDPCSVILAGIYSAVLEVLEENATPVILHAALPLVSSEGFLNTPIIDICKRFRCA